MTFFYRQEKLKTKERKRIKIEDLGGKIKFVSIENAATIDSNKKDQKSNFPDEIKENVDKPVSRPDLIKVQKKEVVTKPTYTVNSLSKLYSKCLKKDSKFLIELEEHLKLSQMTFRLPNIWFNMSAEELKSNVSNYEISDVTRSQMKPSSSLTSLVSKTSSKERKHDKGRRISNIPNPALQELKHNQSVIQFQLSGDKNSNWLSDENNLSTISSVEWCLNRLRCTMKKIQDATAGTASHNFNKPSITYYNLSLQRPSTVAIGRTNVSKFNKNIRPMTTGNSSQNTNSVDNETGQDVASLYHKLRCNLNSINQVFNTKHQQQTTKCVTTGNSKNSITSSVFYPNGKVALNYYQIQDEHIFLLQNDDELNSIVGIFSNSFQSYILWPDYNTIHYTFDSNSCTQYDQCGNLISQMKWPINVNNKLSHTINIHINNNLIFNCIGKDQIYIRFDDKLSKPIEFALHKWMFIVPLLRFDKMSVISTTTLSSRTTSGISKQMPSKLNRKDDSSTNSEMLSTLEKELMVSKTKIHNSLNAWIKFIRDRLKFESSTNRPVKSAFIRGDSQIQPNKLDSSINHSNSGKPNVTIDFSKGQRPQTSLKFPNKSTPVLNNSYRGVICPRRIQSHQKTADSPDLFHTTISNFEASCLCNKFQIPEITDADLFTFLNSVKPNQIIIIGVVSSIKNNCDEEFIVKEKLIEESLVSLITEVYVEDVKNSTQRPCFAYDNKSYRFLLYDISNSAKSLKRSHSLLLKKIHIVPGMCLMFQNSQLLFADFVFNGYNSTKRDLFKQINQAKYYQESGFHIPLDFQISSNNQSRHWMEEMAYSKILTFNQAK